MSNDKYAPDIEGVLQTDAPFDPAECRRVLLHQLLLDHDVPWGRPVDHPALSSRVSLQTTDTDAGDALTLDTE